MENSVSFKRQYYKLLLLSQNENSTSLFDKNSKTYKLSSYQVVVEDQIVYNDRYLYISLIEEYLIENAGAEGNQLFLYEFLYLVKES